MSELIYIQPPEMTAKELAAEICAILGTTLANNYYKISEIKKTLAKHDLLPKETDNPKSACFDE